MKFGKSLSVFEAIEAEAVICANSAIIFPTVRFVPFEDDGESRGGVRIEEGAMLRDHVIVSSGVFIGARTVIGHNVVLRSEVIIGEDVVISHGTILERRTRVGNNVRISGLTHITGGCVIEDDVQIGARVVTINDREMQWRENPTLVAPVFRRACRIGSGVSVMAGVEVGENTLVGAGSVVTKSLAANVVAYGVPAYIRHEL